jgi:hypothetical protein
LRINPFAVAEYSVRPAKPLALFINYIMALFFSPPDKLNGKA